MIRPDITRFLTPPPRYPPDLPTSVKDCVLLRVVAALVVDGASSTRAQAATLPPSGPATP